MVNPELDLLVSRVLAHADMPYDPKKAHDYYMRNRKLHPRDKGSSDNSGSTGGGRHTTYTVREQGGKSVKLNTTQLAEQKAYADHRVKSIQDKLAKLNAALQKKLHPHAPKKETAADKAKAAADAKKYRDKHQQELANKAKTAASKAKASSKKDTKAPAKDSAAGIRKNIAAQKTSLRNAVRKQRELMAASKNG